MHVAECMVYEGTISAAAVTEMISERIHLLPRYRQRVVEAPLGVAHATWEDDPEFDVTRHVDERSLPAPGDDRVLSRICGELYCALLDRRRPLWHLTVLHGHRSGGTVVFLKLHHSMVDGVSSIELIEVLHSTAPGERPPRAPRDEWEPQPVPGVIDRLRDITADHAATALDVVREGIDLLRPGGLSALATRAQALARTVADVAPLAYRPLPRTPFNAPIHAARDLAWVELPIEETREVRNALGGTVNDLVLAILAGGLGRYMRRHGYRTKGQKLHALCPVSVRRTDQSGSMGNQISMVVAPLHVGVVDGPARLRAERASMLELKRRNQADGFSEIIRFAEYYPAPLYRWLWKLWPRSYFPLNITSSNVPGPRQALFLGKHELLHWYPVGVQWTNNALFLCTLSYREHLTLGLVCDPEVVGDVWEVAEDLQCAYEELRDAAGIEPVRPGVDPVEGLRLATPEARPTGISPSAGA